MSKRSGSQSSQPSAARATQSSSSSSTHSSESETAGLRDLSLSQLRSQLGVLTSNVTQTIGHCRSVQTSIDNIQAHTQEHRARIKTFTKLPFEVVNVAECLTTATDDDDTDGDRPADASGQHAGNGGGGGAETPAFVVKTINKVTFYVQNSGLVPADSLTPGTLVAVSPDTHVIVKQLPREFDHRVKAMMVEERPNVSYVDIGGLEQQLEELHEAVVLPITHPQRFASIGIRSPKGVLLYGPPGTGKTLLARAVAAESKATFIKLAGTQLVQKYVGDGAKLVRDAFTLARQAAPAIIFIDELDSVGAKRSSDTNAQGVREIHRTMIELLHQLDGFQPNDNIKIIGATNRVDTLDPALVRSGRLDRKIEIGNPDEVARKNIMRIHARRMHVSADVNYAELAAAADDFSAAQCRAVCTEAGMVALRRNAAEITHNDFMDGLLEVMNKSTKRRAYFA